MLFVMDYLVSGTLINILIDEFASYLNLVSKLEFDERPDYTGYR